jgi:hypothetical protein
MLSAPRPASKSRQVRAAFGGRQGTTLIAAQKTHRRARLIELDPIYVDVIVRRWEKFTGEAAVHADSGLSFGQLAGERLSVAG